MFERYTEKARRVIFFGRYEASQVGAEVIEPLHLLLGVLREDKSLMARFPSITKASVESTREEIEGPLPKRPKISTSVEIHLAPDSKRVFAYAYEESERMRHMNIGVGHLLLGLLREESSLAAQILYRRGLRLSAVREEVLRFESRYPVHSEADIRAKIDEALSSGSHELDLSGGSITELPSMLEKQSWLRKLNIAENSLRELPEFIGHFSQLEYLDLSHNFLTTLPDSLLSLRALKALYLHGNDALDLPEEILGPPAGDKSNGISAESPARILDYYYRVRSSAETRALNEAKLILVGRGAVGKTSIVNRLVFNEFKDEKKTEGIQITKWNLRLNGKELVRLNIWDFGGQEILHATHQFFLTRRSLYLLVLTGREGGEEADAEYWLKLIESFGCESPVIVVLNKIRQYPFDVNRRALQLKYQFIRGFIQTDCESGIGLKELRKAIEIETDLLEELRASFPEHWFAIKETLAVMKTNFLSFDDYRAECSRLGEPDPAAQDTLSAHLHNLGIALNYTDDPRLQDTYVLNPQWVTNGIYSILHSAMVQKSGGEIQLKHLSKILDRKNYPIKMHRFLFDLMKKFELCFSFPDDDCRHLIPELLDKQEAPDVRMFKPKECLNFQYHYSVLPEGLLPRFIVRTNVLSEGSPRWRSGVILNFEGNSALVKADMQEKKVFISVSGTPPGRRRLLAVIRSDFEHIHRDIPKLLPREMVPLPGCPDAVVPYNKLLAMERAGIEELPEIAGDKVVMLNVNDMLNGVDLEGVRLREIMADQPQYSVSMFYSYAHKDETLRDELNTHLKLLQRQGLIKSWFDRNIDAGDDWKRNIDENLERADIILLLISADFIASDYCYEREMKRALERHASGEAKVIPVVVRDVSLLGAPFEGIQYLPKDGRAVTLWANRDSAWRDVAENIMKVTETIRNRKINS